MSNHTNRRDIVKLMGIGGLALVSITRASTSPREQNRNTKRSNVGHITSN
jgi:hypothetical protein